jgi:hypothetical protein
MDFGPESRTEHWLGTQHSTLAQGPLTNTAPGSLHNTGPGSRTE